MADQTSRAPAASTIISGDMVKGILYMLLAMMIIIPVMNTGAKYLQGKYPYGQVLFARYIGHFLCVAVFFATTHGFRVFRAGNFKIQIIRSMLLFSCTACYFYGLQYIELTTAATINFTMPMIVAALAGPVLGERVGWRRYVAVVVGFCGVLLVVQPGGEGFHWAMGLILMTAIMYAAYQLLTRAVSGTDSAETSIIYAALLGSFFSIAMLPGIGNHFVPGLENHTELVMPDNALDWSIFLMLGCAGGFGHYFMTKALGLGEASIISTFTYAQLLGALTLSMLIFGDFPGPMVITGAAIIVGSGIYITLRGNR